MTSNRKSGILLHITSLPNDYGIGDLGKSAYLFVDFLAQSKQKLWQILPLSPTDYYGSPYAPYSAFAGNSYLISPELLQKVNLIPELNPTCNKTELLETAFINFRQSNAHGLKTLYECFCHTNQFWLDDYALFMSFKKHFSELSWVNWPTDIRLRTTKALKYWRQELAENIEFHRFSQFIFYQQWQELKKYAQSKSIMIIGDLPLFVAHDSADVWANRELFQLDSDGFPLAVAGVPPDYFSKTGQLWGNPLYDWNNHAKDGYQWWVKRITQLLRYVDLIRIDHFRGLDAYWEIPYGEKTAINGEWKPGPGGDFFAKIKAKLGSLPFIAEDLGFIDQTVIKLRNDWNLPGMYVLQFAFEALKPNLHSPHVHIRNSVVYTGTHDNNTTLGWFQSAPDEVKDYTCQYINSSGQDISWDLIRTALASPANLAIIPFQDILALDSAARMNLPGTVNGNWRWRFHIENLNQELESRLAELTVLYGR